MSEQSEQKEDVSQERKTDRDFAEQIIQANNAAKQAELDRLKVINENHEEEIAALKVQLQENREAIDRIDQLLSQTEGIYPYHRGSHLQECAGFLHGGAVETDGSSSGADEGTGGEDG